MEGGGVLDRRRVSIKMLGCMRGLGGGSVGIGAGGRLVGARLGVSLFTLGR